MEAFSLLKYWRGGGAPLPPPSSATAAAATTTILRQHHNATDSDDDDDDDDADGPFFDLEFAVPDEVDDPEHSHEDPNATINKHSDQEEEDEEDDDDDNIEECEREFKFTLSPSSNDRGDDPNLSLSPSDDLFFKGKLVQVDPSSSEPNSKPAPPQFTASLFKSATKFRVFRLGGLNKKPKDSNNGASSDSVPRETESQQQKKQQPSERKHFTVKFKVEEVKIMSLFSRDNSSRGNNKKHSNSHSHNPEESPSSSSEEKRSSKEVMNKYLKMVKPLYIRVSRRYGDKLGFSGHLSLSSAADKPAPPPRDTPEKKGSPSKAAAESDAGENRETNTKTEKQGNNVHGGGLRVVCKRLGKSRSASSAAVAAAPAASVSSKRRDDSLLQQQDGIQGAIMHCKRSFNASRTESECCGVREEVAMAMASALEASRKSTNEGKDKRS
ncbi:hypothetical protein HN51_068905 [Arachis hypogaea]|uniref:Membrane-associated kinase regulator n=1 Tax=Arachis hypogaea TaxID=3818 RepID=A0A444Z8E1_ARAHY|nr:probable membrane-associated kinase regulator 2 [Arachis ipaensis]XP_025653828.1 probable membrane-associated kinase regulator 2 [Arachis hypogaea]QHO11062.1 putative membrane-associated kinase regulator [Arachis hypogaea]RYR10462.1 hypothetical protein Ahy_B05g078901 [Arachis hypogaea]